MRVRHVSLFEAVKLGTLSDEEDRSQEQMPIQKIMSVPVVGSGNIMGVVQISRKGLDASLCLLYTSSDALIRSRVSAARQELAYCAACTSTGFAVPCFFFQSPIAARIASSASTEQ